MIVLYYSLVVVMCALGAFGSLFLKKASSFSSIKELLKNYNFYLGGGLYASSAILNIYLLTVLDYIVVLPLTSITYIFGIIIAKFFLKENLTIWKIIGVTLIVVGAVFLIL